MLISVEGWNNNYNNNNNDNKEKDVRTENRSRIKVLARCYSLVRKDVDIISKTYINLQKKNLRRPGVEPGSTAWKATMLTVTPPTLGHETL